MGPPLSLYVGGSPEIEGGGRKNDSGAVSPSIYGGENVSQNTVKTVLYFYEESKMRIL